MSTITLELRSEALAPPPEGPENFWEGLVVGWNAFVGFWAALAIGLGVALPWLVVIAAAVVAVVVVLRRTGRRTAGATPASVPPPPAEG